MNKLGLIISREFNAKVRNKSFLVMTFLSPLLFVGVAILVGYLSTMEPDQRKIAIYDEVGHDLNEWEHPGYAFEKVKSSDINVLKKEVLEEKWYGALYIPKLHSTDAKPLFISEDSPSLGFLNHMEDVISDQLTHDNWKATGLDIATIDAGRADVAIEVTRATGETSVRGLNEIKMILGGLFGYLIMMFIMIYGNMVMRSVIEEKTNRIIEIIVSSVKPFTLMLGKVVGTALAGILQFLIWAVIGVALLFIATHFFGAQTSAAQTVEMAQTMDSSWQADVQIYINEFWKLPLLTTIVSFLLYFIGGYFLYSSFYAAIGAAVDNETDSQQFLFPIMMPLILGVYIGFFTVINDPHGTVATVFSFIPLTSPIVMLMRIPFGVPTWQIVVSLLLLFVTFFAVIWLAARIYRVGILMYGKKPTWKELARWIKF